MVITPHATVGALAGSLAPNLPLAFLAGMASHYCLDAIPHADYSLEDKHFLATDAAIASLLLLRRPSGRAALGALGGITPDLIEFGLPKQRLRQLRRFHVYAHSSHSLSPRASLISQVAITAAAAMLRR